MRRRHGRGEVCNAALLLPYQASGMNVYDMREPCEKPPLCYARLSRCTLLLSSLLPSLLPSLDCAEDTAWPAALPPT